MANFISGDSNTFDALIYGGVNRTADNFLQRLSQSFGANVHSAAMPLFDSIAGSIFESVNLSKGIDHLRALGNKLSNILNPDDITYLNDLLSLQTANRAMRVYIMACPEIREKYQQGLISGYDDLYEDGEPGAVGMDHSDYRAVTNGMYVTHPNGEFESYQFLERKFDELSFHDRCDILNTWDTMKLILLEEKVDPTSPYGSDI